MNSPSIFLTLYEFLSAFFHYPRRRLVKLLREGFIEELEDRVKSLTDFPDEYKKGFSLIKEYVESTRERSLEDVHRELAVEYTRLFINAFPMVPCPPYESFYVNGGLLAQRSAAKVLEIYAKVGYRLRDKFKDLPDHIAVELEFMSILHRMKLKHERKEELNEIKHLFLKEHLLKWAPSFCDNIERNAKLTFYKGLSYILRGLLTMEAKNLMECSS